MQTRQEPPVGVRLTVAGQDEATPVFLERADIQITVAGPLTQVRQTLVFRNPNPRVLEGELLFPLPEGAAVSGFALDVQGVLVDAVPVERAQARVVFEKEVRKGVDPGLLEQLEGNVFRTRVYPLPPSGTRTVQITYSANTRNIPLRWGSRIPEGKVTVDVLGASQAEVRVGGRPLTLARYDDRLTTELMLENATERDVTVTLPPSTEPTVLVEDFTRATGPRPETFFCIADTSPLVKIERIAPRSIGILWDASLSRRKADIKRELALLAQHLAGRTVTVEVLVVRERPEKPRIFRITNGDTRALLAFLKAQPLDGATALNGLIFPRHDYWLWFTDGFSSLTGGLPRVPPIQPIYAIVTSPAANLPWLRRVAEHSGGALTDGTDPNVLGRPHVRLMGVEGEGVLDVQWSAGLITGRLWHDTTTLTLTYGLSYNQVVEKRTVTVRKTSTSAQGLIARQWAAQRVESLALQPELNQEALLALGHAFTLVTPGTSLLVLETLEQHIEHDIAPPRTRPALYAAWLAHEKKEATTKRLKDERQLQSVVQQWNERVAWWRKDFPRTAKPKEKQYLVQDRVARRSMGRASSGPGMGGMAADNSVAARPRSVAPATRAPQAEFHIWRDDVGGQTTGLGVMVKPWTPDVPYLKRLKAAGPSGAYAAYLKERESYAETPAFYLDCAELLLLLGRRDEGLRVLTSLAELQLEDAALLRVLAHRLAQLGEKATASALFRKVLSLRPEEPQSYRDLALVLTDLGQHERALELLHSVVMRHWDRFEGIEVIALTEANAILAKHPGTRHTFDRRLLQNIACDLRITMTWDSDSSDMDLHVIEPTGEDCHYGYPLTQVGGKLSKDFTNGYGPEDYLIRRAVPGVYKIQTNYFGSGEQKLTGGTTVQATIITHFGRPTEKRQHLTLRLTKNKETITIGEVRVG